MTAVEPKPTTSLLAVRHAARLFRVGGIVGIEDGGRVLEAIAAEAVTEGVDGGLLGQLPPGSVLVLTGQRLASLGATVEPHAVHALPIPRGTGTRQIAPTNPPIGG